MIDPRPMEEKIASLSKETVNENGRDYKIYLSLWQLAAL